MTHSPLQIGDLVGDRYQLRRRIACGGQASVWEAVQHPFQRRIALKILTPMCDAAGLERMIQEARILAALPHPNIVRIIDCGPTGDRFFLALEYIDGVDLKTLLRQRVRRPQQLLLLLGQVCEALDFAHRCGVIHRDIKLKNILIHSPGGLGEQARVVDFGIARLMDGDPGLTSEGVVLGSPRFMAPELIRGEPFDHRVDIYAVGVLLYCCLVGRYPFNGSDPRAIMMAQLTHRLPDIHFTDPDLDRLSDLKDIVRCCLARFPEARFTDMAALHAALHPFLQLASVSEPVLAEEQETVMISRM